MVSQYIESKEAKTSDGSSGNDHLPRKATSKRRSSFLKSKPSTSIVVVDSRKNEKSKGVTVMPPGSNSTPGLRSCLKNDDGKKSSSISDRGVEFDCLEVYMFLISIGDNPSCEGAPVCMSQELVKSETLNVNEYERKRRTRRQRKELVMSPSRRCKLLLALGFTMEDIATAAVETQKARQERFLSLENKKWDRFSAIAEAASRKLKKIVGASAPKVDQNSVVSRVA